jgi:hypothetical protein
MGGSWFTMHGHNSIPCTARDERLRHVLHDRLQFVHDRAEVREDVEVYEPAEHLPQVIPNTAPRSAYPTGTVPAGNPVESDSG